MTTFKPLIGKRSGKHERERKVLLGLIEYHLKTGKPVGSNTLKEAGFGDISSATIRNYFANLEEEGYLTQQHSSGGRLPTHKAYKTYAEEYAGNENLMAADDPLMSELRNTETREIAAYMQNAAEQLSKLANCAVYLSAPRFDQDFIVGLKLVPIDHARTLCVMITDFGVIQTELLHTDKKISSFSAKRLEAYFHWRLTGNDEPENLEPEEEKYAQTLYNELMVRYIVGYSNFSSEDIYRTGFSKLLSFPEFHDPVALSSSLSLFENVNGMRLMLKETMKIDKLKFWIGEDLLPFTNEVPNCAAIAVPYHINQQSVGAVGILGPARIPYRELFALLRSFSFNISTALTRSIYRFKISFRQPQSGSKQNEIGQARLMLLEDKRK